MLKLLKEYWNVVFVVFVFISIGILILNGTSQGELSEWGGDKLYDITIGDATILIVIHAYISRK